MEAVGDCRQQHLYYHDKHDAKGLGQANICNTSKILHPEKYSQDELLPNYGINNYQLVLICINITFGIFCLCKFSRWFGDLRVVLVIVFFRLVERTGIGIFKTI